jgi:alpha-tubulin suppressor-like RCC1 family protein
MIRYRQRGQGLLEYSLVVALIAVVLIGLLNAVGGTAKLAFCQISNALQTSGCVLNSWGYGQNGQLGNGQIVTEDTPVSVEGIPQAQMISAGGYHALAITMDGNVWAWGDNGNGQLGDGNTNDTDAPVQVAGLSSIVAVASGGYHSLALKSDGTLYAWGYNVAGQVGNGTTTDAWTPVQILGPGSGIKAIAAGFYFSMALMTNGTVWIWGDNSNGQQANGSSCSPGPCAGNLVPTQIAGLSNIGAIAAGGYFGAALRGDGTLWEWGDNSHGQLGDGTTTRRTAPVQAGITGQVSQIAAGLYHTMALRADGTLWDWGYNAEGQLGNGTTTQSATPVQVPGTNWGSATSTGEVIGAGEYFSFAGQRDGSLWAWGDNSRGQLGIGSICSPSPCGVSSPGEVPGITRVTEISGGANATLVLSNG